TLTADSCGATLRPRTAFLIGPLLRCDTRRAMSEENLELLRRATEALQGVDLAPAIRAALVGNRDAIQPEVAAAFLAWMNLFDPDVEIDTTRVNMPGFGVF